MTSLCKTCGDPIPEKRLANARRFKRKVSYCSTRCSDSFHKEKAKRRLEAAEMVVEAARKWSISSIHVTSAKALLEALRVYDAAKEAWECTKQQ